MRPLKCRHLIPQADNDASAQEELIAAAHQIYSAALIFLFCVKSLQLLTNSCFSIHIVIKTIVIV